MRHASGGWTVTVDPELVEAASEAFADGEADSLSSWVNAALSEKVGRSRKLAHLGAAIADYESDLGEITAEEIATQARADREEAVVVRGRRASAAAGARRASKTASA